MINIRRASPADLPSILRIETKSFAHDAWDRAVFLDYFARPALSVFLVATVDRTIAGYALACHTPTRAELHSIAVGPSYRGKGIAVALMRRVIATLARRGFSTVSLNVRLENIAAIRLYRTYGFQRLRRVNDYYEDGAPSWRMRRGAIS